MTKTINNLYNSAVLAYTDTVNDKNVINFVKACTEAGYKTNAVQSALGIRINKTGKLTFAKEDAFERALSFLAENFNAKKAVNVENNSFFFRSGKEAFCKRTANARVMDNCKDMLTNEPTGRTAEEITEAIQDRAAAQQIFDDKWVRFNHFNDTLFDEGGKDNNPYELWLSKTKTKAGNYLAWVKYTEIKNNPFWQYNRRVKGHYDKTHRMMCVVASPEQGKLIIDSFKQVINNQNKEK